MKGGSSSDQRQIAHFKFEIKNVKSQIGNLISQMCNASGPAIVNPVAPGSESQK